MLLDMSYCQVPENRLQVVESLIIPVVTWVVHLLLKILEDTLYHESGLTNILKREHSARLVPLNSSLLISPTISVTLTPKWCLVVRCLMLHLQYALQVIPTAINIVSLELVTWVSLAAFVRRPLILGGNVWGTTALLACWVMIQLLVKLLGVVKQAASLILLHSSNSLLLLLHHEQFLKQLCSILTR